MPDWNQPPPSEWWRPRDFLGELCAFEVTGYNPDYSTNLTRPGDEGAAIANVTVLTGPNAGQRYPEATINQAVLRAALRDNQGAWLLARIGQGTAKPGQSAAFILLDFTEADAAIADRYFQTGEAEVSPASASPLPDPQVRPYTPPSAEPATGEVSVNPDDRVAQLEAELMAARSGSPRPPF